MKKTLMTVLCFALGASFATAQTNTVERVKANQQQQMAVSAAGEVTTTGYKGSIFTKDDVAFFTTTFSAADETAAKFTTGTIAQDQQVGDQTAVAHGQNATHSRWYRAADTTMATLNAMVATGYWPSLVGPGNSFSSFASIISDSPMDGFMVMTMQDQIAAWGGSGTPGNFDSYIQFESFATTGAPVIDVRLWQYYRKFNSDQCFMDYSLDGGTTWAGTTEFNVRGVDVASNSAIRGRVLVTMPAACANVSSVTLRLRWTCSSNNGGAYGYYWILDDFEVSAGEASRLNIVSYSNYDGFYHLMPEGLQVPLCSYVTFANNGSETQANVMSKIFAYSDANTNATVLAESETIASVPFDPGTQQQAIIDPLGFMGNTGFDYSDQAGLDEAATGTLGTLPTNLAAGTMGFYYNQLSSDSLTYNLDTFNYEVSHAGDITSMPENMMWGRDNGVLRYFSRFSEGLTYDGYLTDDPADNGSNSADYSVRMAYTTGEVVPEGWVIRGIQLVASTYPGYASAGTQIYPILTIDSAGIPDAQGSFSIYFLGQEHGAGVHTVAESEVNTLEVSEVFTRGNYNVINIQFPNQPELKAKTSYRIGYQLVQPATFTLAGATNYKYNADSNAVRFDTLPEYEVYKNVQTLPYTKILVYDPVASDFGWVGNTAGTNIPMMRMIVGPKVYIPNYALTVECGEGTEILDGEYNSVCGMVDSLAEGSTNVFYAQATIDGAEIDKVYLDGVELTDGDGILTMDVDDNGYAYAIIELADVRAAHTLTTSSVSIDPVTGGVKMKLQPNPATNNVQLSISGVEGMVNYSLLDMSGRVISSARINAESINNIDLSKLAKGAYFVRITSDKFSKVEKLIVR